MEEIYDDVDNVKTLSSSSSTIQEGPRRLLRASVLGLGLLSVFLLAGLIGLAVHYHNSVGGAAADLSAVKANLTSVTEEKDNLTERLQARDQLINQLKANLTESLQDRDEEISHMHDYLNQCYREVDRLHCLNNNAKTCPEGWRKFGCSCYLLSTEKAYWEQSRDNCTAGGAHLVIIHSYEEQESISSMIKEPTWIGMSYSDREEEGIWKWVDGSPLNLNPMFWHQSLPDNGGWSPYYGEQYCAYFNAYKELNDRSCRTNLHWICLSVGRR
ncbi:CD209 antigen-like protein E isoform X1 [Trematomus bernacchii]|uniref:CD209 antigen-like protein E isoform X1 n=1 Tax=Trematomus bernacchii TaxID=40690 RepID=UPI00146D1DFF|nr:CD209 antigen-like protein E isoform X1 [Trematomus bernacchii]XP_033992135.1 CD209 antigen-like protein E isoform X1 [Trematomus bernacchii]